MRLYHRYRAQKGKDSDQAVPELHHDFEAADTDSTWYNGASRVRAQGNSVSDTPAEPTELQPRGWAKRGVRRSNISVDPRIAALLMYLSARRIRAFPCRAMCWLAVGCLFSIVSAWILLGLAMHRPQIGFTQYNGPRDGYYVEQSGHYLGNVNHEISERWIASYNYYRIGAICGVTALDYCFRRPELCPPENERVSRKSMENLPSWSWARSEITGGSQATS